MAVVGSAVVDFIAHVPARPRPGETVLARDLTVAVGGKGCNQAIAAARLGAEVAFVGCVGDDALGEMIRQALVRDGVDASHLLTTSDDGTAIGMPVVDDSGQNAIVMAPRANMRLTPEDVEAAAALDPAGRRAPPPGGGAHGRLAGRRTHRPPGRRHGSSSTLRRPGPSRRPSWP